MKKINHLFLWLVLFSANISFAQDGTPDTSFVGNGKVVTDFGPYNSSVTSLGIQSDGRIIAIGNVRDMSNYNQFGLARYSPDGSLDTTFGTFGIVKSDFLGFEISNFSMHIQSDDKIVIGGSGINPNKSFLLRLDADGTLDPNFGDGGIVLIELSLTNTTVLQLNDSITFVGTLNQNSLEFIRFNQDGILDGNFGNGGIADNPIGNLSSASHTTLQADGKIVVVWNSTLNDDGLQIMRFDSNGFIDFTFGLSGAVALGGAMANMSEFFLKIQRDGKILVVATAAPSSSSSASSIVRLLPNGNLDTSFGVQSTVSTEVFQGGRPTALEVQTDGKILVGGYTVNPPLGFDFNDIVVARFLANGIPDASFGNDGVTKNPTGIDSFANALVLQTDGKILVGGSEGLSPNTTFALWRFNSSGTLANAKFDAVNTAFKAYPNPVKEILNLDFSLNEPANLSIDLYDSLGRSVRTLLKSKDFQTGYNTQQLVLPQTLSDGLYFLNISDGKNASTVKIVK